ELAHALCDLEDDRHRAERFRKSAGAGRLLPDAAAGEGERLVGEARTLPTDADLNKNEVGVLDRAIEVVRDLERAAELLALEHPARKAADHLAPLAVDVVQHELRHVEAREPGHELGRVRGAAADDRDLHP